MSAYTPPQPILERYARLLVSYGLRDGEGIRPGETVMVAGEEDSKPLFYEVCCEVWRNGGNVIQRFKPADDGDHNLAAAFYELATDAQLDFYAESYNRGLIDQADHIIFIVGDRDPAALRGVDTAKFARKSRSLAKYWEHRMAKERAGKLHWTLGLYGTAGHAREAGLSIEQYWRQIIDACHLDDPDPVARFIETQARIARYRDWLTALRIDRLHVEAEGTDLWLTLGEQRRWLGGGGANIPSFEIFTSPDWRGTSGRISFSEPLYYYGNLLRGVSLEFVGGVVVRADAEENGDLIRQMVAMPGGNRVGEFSMTDSRLSRITKFMADTLYDENVGGRYGNTHLAIGMSLTETFAGDESTLTAEDCERLGFNADAALHSDIVSTTDRTVTATLKDGSTQVIYADGKFTLD